MKQLTRQEIFDAALFGIRSQNYARSADDSGCLYDGPNNTHCAVGWALVEAGVQVAPENNGAGVYGLAVCDDGRAADVLGLHEGNQQTFLEDLQGIHDGDLAPGEVGENFESLMRAFAGRFSLTYKEIGVSTAWSGSPCPLDPDNFWIDETGERVNAQTGERCSGGAA